MSVLYMGTIGTSLTSGITRYAEATSVSRGRTQMLIEGENCGGELPYPWTTLGPVAADWPSLLAVVEETRTAR